jgi:hypothetical protein
VHDTAREGGGPRHIKAAWADDAWPRRGRRLPHVGEHSAQLGDVVVRL